MEVLIIQDERYNVESLPEDCPRCHRAIAAVPRRGGITFDYPHNNVIQSVFQCPACKKLFLAWYEFEDGCGTLKKVEPKYPPQTAFDALQELSPQFPIIYNQATAAEVAGLSEIAGLGYRKALEFLIKDFCISKHPKDAEAIKTEFLGQVIKNRISDRKIMMAAEKAIWLGNDEAHYFRRWENHDIDDL